MGGADAVGPQPYLENHCSPLQLRDKGEEKVYAGGLQMSHFNSAYTLLTTIQSCGFA